MVVNLSDSDPSSLLQQANARKLAVSFFAVIGFVASIITVLEYVRPTETSALDVTLDVHLFRTANYSAKSLQSDGPARTLIKDMQRLACSELDVTEINQATRAQISRNKDDEQREQKLECKDFIEIEFAARWNGEFSESDGRLFEYTIKNIGEKAAEDIRIQGKNLNSLQFQSGSSFVDVGKNSQDEYFELPKLNPGENLRVLAWSSRFFSDVSYGDWDDYPIVTFAGSEVHTELLKPVPDQWYEFYDFFVDAPIVIIAIFIILAAFVVIGILYLIVGSITAIATGKSFSEVFSNDADASEATNKNEAEKE